MVVPAPFFVRVPSPANTPAIVSVVPVAGATVMPELAVIVVPDELFN